MVEIKKRRVLSHSNVDPRFHMKLANTYAKMEKQKREGDYAAIINNETFQISRIRTRRVARAHTHAIPEATRIPTDK